MLAFQPKKKRDGGSRRGTRSKGRTVDVERRRGHPASRRRDLAELTRAGCTCTDASLTENEPGAQESRAQ